MIAVFFYLMTNYMRCQWEYVNFIINLSHFLFEVEKVILKMFKIYKINPTVLKHIASIKLNVLTYRFNYRCP